MNNRFERFLVLATNLAVLAGLLLLVYELQQNRESIDIETQFAISEAAIQTHLAVAGDDELAQLVTAATAGDTENFSESDALRVRSWHRAMMEPRISFYWLRDSDFINADDWCNFMGFVLWSRTKDYYRSIMDRDIAYAEEMADEIRSRCGEFNSARYQDPAGTGA
jgi:hypothetical protein